ncbi:MAG: hypothetical protein J7K51_05425 [Thermotogae bacterium]|nr:hypothetical protein [Thermotogota bacterium]
MFISFVLIQVKTPTGYTVFVDQLLMGLCGSIPSHTIHSRNRRDITSTSPSISPEANDIMELRSIGQV